MAVQQDWMSGYAGYGIPSLIGSPIDSGAVATTTTPKTITLTVPTRSDGTQPTCFRGKVFISVNTANAAAVLGQIDISSSDGTNTVRLDSIPAAVASTGGRGGIFIRDLFIDRVDTTTIKTIVVVIATTVNNNYTAQVMFAGETD